MQKMKIQKRIRRHNRVRSGIQGTEKRPRLAVFRANQNIYAQIIDDESQRTIVSASSLELKGKGTAKSAAAKKTDIATQVGALVAKKAQEKNITEVVFDRGGFKYHGRVKALADAAREAGLKF